MASLTQRSSLIAESVKNMPAMQETWVQFLGQEDPLEKEMSTHSHILAWRIPWTEETGRLQSIGSQRVRHSLATKQQFYLLFVALPWQCCRNFLDQFSSTAEHLDSSLPPAYFCISDNRDSARFDLPRQITEQYQLSPEPLDGASIDTLMCCLPGSGPWVVPQLARDEGGRRD